MYECVWCVCMHVCALILTAVGKSESGQQAASSTVLDAAQFLGVRLLSQPQLDPHVVTGTVQWVSCQDPTHTHTRTEHT